MSTLISDNLASNTANSREVFQGRVFDSDQTDRASPVILCQQGWEIGGRDGVRAAAGLAPFHEETVGQASEHAKNPDAVIALNAAPVIVVGDIQTLVQSAFDPPARPIELEPLHRVQTFGRSTGNQGDGFLLASGSLSKNPRGLLCQGKADVFGLNLRRGNGPIFSPALVLLAGARRRRSGLDQGDIRSGSGDFLFYRRPQGGLVVLDGEQGVASALQHEGPGGFILSMQRVQADQATLQIQRWNEFFLGRAPEPEFPAASPEADADRSRRKNG